MVVEKDPHVVVVAKGEQKPPIPASGLASARTIFELRASGGGSPASRSRGRPPGGPSRREKRPSPDSSFLRIRRRYGSCLPGRRAPGPRSGRFRAELAR